jgi:hypothetical protein
MIDTGFGSPTSFEAMAGSIVIPKDGLVADEGGWLCEVVAINGFVDQDYRARFKDPSNGNVYPVGDYCYSGVPEQGHVLRPFGPVSAKDTINFTAPSCPPAVYDLVLFFGPNFAQSYTIESAFTVEVRNRSRATLRSRLRLPDPYKTGPRLMRQFPTPTAPEFLNPLECLTLALGQGVQAVLGTPATRTAFVVGAGGTTVRVETTLGFPSSGQLFIGDRSFGYTAKTSTAFTGVVLLPSSQLWVQSIPVLTEVTYDASSYIPVD